MKTKTSPKLFRDDLKSLFKAYKPQLIWITILSTFLFFLLHIFIGISFYGNSINEGLKNKLGMYFYIKDNPEEETEIYKQVMSLKEKLQTEWIKVSFSSKEDSLNFLEKRLPDLSKNFKKFGISNPLPATLYITFNDKEQYETLKKIMLENREIIVNIQDLTQLDNLDAQETRIINIIKLFNFVQIFCRSFVGILIFVVLSFIIFFLRGLFYIFKKDMQVKKILGASSSQIIQPFIRLILFSSILSFFISLCLTGGTIYIFDYYMEQVFELTLLPYLGEHRKELSILIGMELCFLSLLSLGISYQYVHHLYKKLR